MNALQNVRIKVGGIETPVDYAGLAGGYVGLYQFNFQMPSVPSGDQKVEIITDGQPLTQVLYMLVE